MSAPSQPAAPALRPGGHDVDATHQRARRGIRLLMGRQVIVQAFTFAGGVVLARVLDPVDFGLYAIATFVVGAFALLGDFGLAPSLIQRQEGVTEHDLRVGFTLQQIVTGVVVATLLLFAPRVAALYPKAPRDTAWLVRALAATLYLTSWRAMSALQLERDLRYGALARAEVVESLSFQLIAVGLAVAGYGVWSFVWAALARGVLGVALVFRAAPWRVRLAWDRRVAWGLLRYGMPFQLQTVANQVGGWITPLFAGALLGPGAVGYLTWASSNGRKPLLLVDNVMRVAFPHFARIQHDMREVERTITRYLTYLLLAAGFWFVVLLGAGRDAVTLVYTNKWAAAVPALIIYAAVVALDVVAWVVGVALNGVGRVTHSTTVVTVRSVGQLLLGVPLVKVAGLNGVPIATLAASLVAVPWLVAGLGPGAVRRLAAPVAWVLVPVACGSAVGLVLQHLPFTIGPRSVLTGLAVALAYATAARVASPAWVTERWVPEIVSRFARVRTA